MCLENNSCKYNAVWIVWHVCASLCVDSVYVVELGGALVDFIMKMKCTSAYGRLTWNLGETTLTFFVFISLKKNNINIYTCIYICRERERCISWMKAREVITPPPEGIAAEMNFMCLRGKTGSENRDTGHFFSLVWKRNSKSQPPTQRQDMSIIDAVLIVWVCFPLFMLIITCDFF